MSGFLLLVAETVNAPDRAKAASLMAAPKVCPDHPANGGRRAMAKAQRSLRCLINHARKRQGLWSYRQNGKLNWSAHQKAGDILRCGFTHNACHRPFDYWIFRSRYVSGGSWATGENIAWGSGGLGNVRSIFKAWMHSPPHRRAILSRGYSDFGTGVVRGRFEGIPGARVWVIHFGKT